MVSTETTLVATMVTTENADVYIKKFKVVGGKVV